MMRISCTINGEPQQADDVWEGESLLYVLRERLGLPGSKNACEQGECGSCTVYLDGILVCACLVAAGAGPPDPNGRGAQRRRTAGPDPASVPAGRGGAVRLLHAGPAGGRA
jgi:hypothetical protein